jgi:hypothetical protein
MTRNKFLITSLCFVVLAICPSVRAHNNNYDQFVTQFDEFDFSDCESLAARLDNFAVEMSHAKNQIGFILVYGGREVRRGEMQMYKSRIQSYLIKRRGLDARKFRVQFSGYRETAGVVIVIEPAGVSAPNLIGIVDSKAVKFKRERVKSSEYDCVKDH